MSETNATDDLVRCLNLIPYFQAHPNDSVFEAAARLGTTPQTILSDLRRLHLCGLPGLMPDDLIDLAFDYTGVDVINSQGLDAPLRLSALEAATLRLRLEALENHPELADRGVVRSAARKLETLTSSAEELAGDPVDEPADADDPVSATIRAALKEDRRLALRYRSASSDSLSDRPVSPLRIFSHGTFSYLVAYDHDAEAHRTFRTDRIDHAEVLDQQAVHAAQGSSTPDASPFDFGDEAHSAQIRIKTASLWLAEYYPIHFDAEALKGDPAEISVTMTYGSPAWLTRFALGNADHLQITGPKKLVDVVSRAREDALAAYAQM